MSLWEENKTDVWCFDRAFENGIKKPPIYISLLSCGADESEKKQKRQTVSNAADCIGLLHCGNADFEKGYEYCDSDAGASAFFDSVFQKNGIVSGFVCDIYCEYGTGFGLSFGQNDSTSDSESNLGAFPKSDGRNCRNLLSV